jgi:hypothetical protein
MQENGGRVYSAIRGIAENIFVPLHWATLVFADWHLTATTIGTLALLAYVTASVHHARKNGISHLGSAVI